MKRENITYEYAKSYIKDKDRAINTFVDNSLNKSQEMFLWGGLPETIPQDELERLLLTKGNCFVTKVNDELYALSGGIGGEPDAYNRPRFYTVANVALNLSKTYEIGVDGILVKNDYTMQGVLPLIYKYGALLLDADISLNSAAVISRIQMLISAPDDKTKASADLFLQHIYDGDYSIIGENQFFEGIKLQTPPTGNGQYITQFIELVQYYKASFLNEMGLNANYNMKRERLSDNEIALNIDAILPFSDNMYNQRLKAAKAINEMFGTDIVVDYNSAWKTTHEHAEKETMDAETNLEIIGETETGEQITLYEDNIETDSDNPETNSDNPETDSDNPETESDNPETDSDTPETDSDDEKNSSKKKDKNDE